MSSAGFSRVKTTYTGEQSAQVAQERPLLAQTAKPVLHFTQSDLHRCLYRRNEVKLVNKEDLRTSLQHEEEFNSYCK